MAMIKTCSTPPIAFPEVSGPICSFKALQELPLKKCEVAINAWQEGSGDPSPENERAIHGFSEVNTTRCGVNIWSEDWELGDINNTTGETTPSNIYIRSKDYEIIKPSTQYCVSLFQISVFYYDASKAFISRVLTSADNQVITTPSNARFFKIKRYNTTYSNDISLNYPSTQTGYIAYTGNTYTIQLGQEVFGAEVDVVNGVAHVTHEMVTYDGSENGWTWFDTFNQSSIQLPHNAVYEYLNITGYISDYFKSVSNADRNNNVGNYCSLVGSGSQVAFSSSETSLNNFKSWLSNHNTTFVYKLAEPFDIQLTPTQIETLIGNNTIFADTGDTTVQYIKIGG